MHLYLERFAYSPRGVLGRLTIGDLTLFTVERPWLGNKPFESCIPQGAYRCERYSSTKYPNTFEVVDVPGRSKILFHAANFPQDVEGCIGLGLELMDDRIAVSHSRNAMGVFRDLTAAVERFDLLVSQYTPEYP